MSSESPEDPFQNPEVTKVSTVKTPGVKTPGVLGMVGAVIISLLAAGGACCASCLGAISLVSLEDGFIEVSILLGGVVTLGTFVGVLVVLTRTVNAIRSQQKGDGNDVA